MPSHYDALDEVSVAAFESAAMLLNDFHAIRYPDEHPALCYIEDNVHTSDMMLATDWQPSAESSMLIPNRSVALKVGELMMLFKPIQTDLSRCWDDYRPAQIRNYVDQALIFRWYMESLPVEHTEIMPREVLPPDDVLDSMWQSAESGSDRCRGLGRFISRYLVSVPEPGVS